MDGLQKLLQFLGRLEAARLHYVLGHFRDSVNVMISVPGERWEVEFFEGGRIEVEIFANQGADTVLEGEKALERLFAEHTT